METMKKIITIYFLLLTSVINAQWSTVVSNPNVNVAYSSVISGNYIYLASDNANEINVYDITQVTTTYTPTIYVGYDHVFGMALQGNFLYISRYVIGDILKIDLTQTTNNSTVVVSGLGGPCGMAFNGNDLYICELDANKISKIDVTQVTPTPVNVVTSVATTFKIELSGNYIYYTSSYYNIDRVDITQPTPTIQNVVNSLTSSTVIRGLAFDGNDLYFAQDVGNQISKVDITQTLPLTVTNLVSFNGPQTLLYNSGNLYVSDLWQCLKYDLNFLKNESFSSTNSIQLSPNPVQTSFKISNYENINSVEIYSIDGKLVKTISNPLLEIDVDGLVKGCYMLKAIGKDGAVFTNKFIKS